MALAWCTEHGADWNKRCPACQDAVLIGDMEAVIHKLKAENAQLKADLRAQLDNASELYAENAKLLLHGAEMARVMASMTEQFGMLWAVADAARELARIPVVDFISQRSKLAEIRTLLAALDAPTCEHVWESHDAAPTSKRFFKERCGLCGAEQ